MSERWLDEVTYQALAPEMRELYLRLVLAHRRVRDRGALPLDLRDAIDRIVNATGTAMPACLAVLVDNARSVPVLPRETGPTLPESRPGMVIIDMDSISQPARRFFFLSAVCYILQTEGAHVPSDVMETLNAGEDAFFDELDVVYGDNSC